MCPTGVLTVLHFSLNEYIIRLSQVKLEVVFLISFIFPPHIAPFVEKNCPLIFDNNCSMIAKIISCMHIWYIIQGDQKKRRQNLICPNNKVFYGIQLILLVFGFSMFLCLVYICS